MEEDSWADEEVPGCEVPPPEDDGGGGVDVLDGSNNEDPEGTADAEVPALEPPLPGRELEGPVEDVRPLVAERELEGTDSDDPPPDEAPMLEDAPGGWSTHAPATQNNPPVQVLTHCCRQNPSRQLHPASHQASPLQR
jgi:hypothetical protein